MSTHSAWRGELFNRSLPKSLYSSGLQRASHMKVKTIAPIKNRNRERFRFIEVRNSSTSSGMTRRWRFGLSPGRYGSFIFENKPVDAPSASAVEHHEQKQPAKHH